MYPVTSDAVQILNSNAKQTVSVTVTTADGDTFTVTEQDIPIGGLSVDRYSAVGNGIEIGTATASELQLNLLNDDGKFNTKAFEGAQLFVRVWVENPDSETVRGIHAEDSSLLLCESGDTLCMEDWNEPPEETVYPKIEIPIGRFTVDNSPRKLSVIQLTALDGMVKFDKKADKRQLQFPRAVSDLLTDICEICGVQMADYSVQNLFNADYEVSAYPETEDLTYRQLLIWICQITCTCAYMDWSGHLRLGWYSDTEPAVSVTAAQRFDSDLQEQSITVTGVQIQTDAQTVYTSEDENGVHEDGYVLCIQSNGLIQQEIQALANAIGNKVRGFTYTPFSAKVFPMPYLFPTDTVDFVRADNTVARTVLTNVNYTLNGTTQIAAKGETQTRSGYASLGTLTSGQRAAIDAVNKKTEAVRTDLTAQESATLHLNQTAASAMGMYYKEVTDENGGVVRYWHDNESLENSLYICMQNSGGSFSTNTGWNHGNPQWTAGTDKFGNAVVSLLNTIGIQAEWIQADSITTDKLSIGQSERGTNLIEDSSFEHGGVFYRATYSDDTEDAVIVSPAHNDSWNAVNFDSSETYGAQYRGWLEVPSVGGFDGNKAILDVNHKGLSENEEEWFTGYEQIQPIPIEMLTHTVSFYYRVHRYPIGTPQGTETAHAKYAFKIQWLDGNGAEISCTFQSFSVQSDGTETWNRLYAAVNPPNGTVSAKFAIGFVCTDLATWNDGGETGEAGYPDLAFLDLDGILFEAGTSLNTWTCSESELKNTGVIINSNGINIADGKISVKDIYGRKVLYTDGNNHLQLVGGLTAQMYDKTDNRVCAQMQIASSNERNPYADSSGTFDNSFLGQTFTRFDKDGTAERVGHIGMTFTQDENVSNDRPMEFYSENGFSFNGTRPLISDPVYVSSGKSLNSLTKAGWYYNNFTKEVETMYNVPKKVAFLLRVEIIKDIIQQTFTTVDLSYEYRRWYKTWEPIGWSEWKITAQTVIPHPDIRLSSMIAPGTYIVEENDILFVQEKNSSVYEDAYPVKKRGILECFQTSENYLYQRFTTWDGYIYVRNSYASGWTYWRNNGITPGI